MGGASIESEASGLVDVFSHSLSKSATVTDVVQVAASMFTPRVR
jgi:hypothetical protein